MIGSEMAQQAISMFPRLCATAWFVRVIVHVVFVKKSRPASSRLLVWRDAETRYRIAKGIVRRTTRRFFSLAAAVLPHFYFEQVNEERCFGAL